MTAPANLGNWNRLREPRIGICLHYDASVSDAGAVTWLTKDPRCHVSYHEIVLDDGTRVPIAPLTARAWHAGVCRPSSTQLAYHDANSALYGVAIAARDGDRVTEVQLDGVVDFCLERFRAHGWTASETWRITSHRLEAWPRGRKTDCEGDHLDHPVLDLEVVRRRVKLALRRIA